VVHQKNNKEEAEEPKCRRRGTSTVQDSITEAFDVTNFSFGKVLVLVMRFALEVLDLLDPEDVMNALANFNPSIVREETVGCAMFADKVLESGGHLGFSGHAISDGLGTVLACIYLSHGVPAVSEDAITVSGYIGEDCDSGNIFIPFADICSRPA
jgi:hypothetical protein